MQSAAAVGGQLLRLRERIASHSGASCSAVDFKLLNTPFRAVRRPQPSPCTANCRAASCGTYPSSGFRNPGRCKKYASVTCRVSSTATSQPIDGTTALPITKEASQRPRRKLASFMELAPLDLATKSEDVSKHSHAAGAGTFDESGASSGAVDLEQHRQSLQRTATFSGPKAHPNTGARLPDPALVNKIKSCSTVDHFAAFLDTELPQLDPMLFSTLMTQLGHSQYAVHPAFLSRLEREKLNKVLDRVCAAAQRRTSSFRPQQFRSFLWAMAKVKYRPKKAWLEVFLHAMQVSTASQAPPDPSCHVLRTAYCVLSVQCRTVNSIRSRPSFALFRAQNQQCR